MFTTFIEEVIQLKYRTINARQFAEVSMKYAVVIALITVLVLAIPAITGGCGESPQETVLPTATGSPEQPGEAWQADGVLGDNEYLGEMTYGDFEVRFFVDGSGLFYLHVDDKVYLVLCEKGDLISVPANVSHWFDMGKEPSFKCIRLFTTEDGWVGDFTGSDIASKFPDMDAYVKDNVASLS